MLRPMESYSEAADREIVEALRRGDDSAFSALVDRHEKLMLRVAGTYVRNPEVAREVVQDTWLSVLSGIEAFEGRSSLKTWIFRILVNRAKTRGARESRSVPFSSLAVDGSAEPVQADTFAEAETVTTPEQRLISRETLGHAVRAMRRLPDGQRQVIALRDLHGCSSDEVCATLGITGGNQRVQLHRARAKVRRELEAYFSTAALGT
jgi:RNA polymerase sigma-70 factor (ECF subfamily)